MVVGFRLGGLKKNKRRPRVIYCDYCMCVHEQTTTDGQILTFTIIIIHVYVSMSRQLQKEGINVLGNGVTCHTCHTNKKTDMAAALEQSGGDYSKHQAAVQREHHLKGFCRLGLM